MHPLSPQVGSGPPPPSAMTGFWCDEGAADCVKAPKLAVRSARLIARADRRRVNLVTVNLLFGAGALLEISQLTSKSLDKILIVAYRKKAEAERALVAC